MVRLLKTSVAEGASEECPEESYCYSVLASTGCQQQKLEVCILRAIVIRNAMSLVSGASRPRAEAHHMAGVECVLKDPTHNLAQKLETGGRRAEFKGSFRHSAAGHVCCFLKPPPKALEGRS